MVKKTAVCVRQDIFETIWKAQNKQLTGYVPAAFSDPISAKAVHSRQGTEIGRVKYRD